MNRIELCEYVLTKLENHEQIITGTNIASFLLEFKDFEKNLFNEMYNETITKVGKILTTEILLDPNIEFTDLSIYDLNMKEIVNLSEYQSYVF